MLRRIGLTFFSTLLAIGVIGTLAGLMGRLWWVCDLLGHFRLQYLFLIVVGSLLCWLLQARKRVWIGILAGAVNVWVILPLYFVGPEAAASAVGSMRAVLMNVELSNRAHGRILEVIRQLDPDILLALEVTPELMKDFRLMSGEYQILGEESHGDAFGIALLSRLPVEEVEILRIGAADLPSVRARFRLGSRELTLIGTHPLPPISSDYTSMRDEHLSGLAKLVREQETPVMVLGDLNTTSWSWSFVQLLRQSGLKDSRLGFGIQATWPAHPAWIRIPIDHVLISSEVVIRDRAVGPKINSDHLPVVVDFSLASRTGFLSLENTR